MGLDWEIPIWCLHPVTWREMLYCVCEGYTPFMASDVLDHAIAVD